MRESMAGAATCVDLPAPTCVLLNGCDQIERCVAERFCGVYLDDLRSDDPVDTDADDLAVLRGWSGLSDEAAKADHDLTVMPMWRFREAVARLSAQRLVHVSYYGAIRGATDAGRAWLSFRPHTTPSPDPA